MAERQALRDAVSVGWINDGDLAEAAAAFRVFGLGQMASARVEAQNLAGGGDFEPLGHGFFRFNAFGTSHKFNSIAKERGVYAASRFGASAIFNLTGPAPLNRYGPLVLNIVGTGKSAGAELVAGMSIGAPAFSCFNTSSVKSISGAL